MSHPFAFAQAQHQHPTRDWTGYCLVFVRSCFGVGPRYPSAADAWRNAEHRHHTTDPGAIPRGVPVFWTGGSHGYGHVALSRGRGSCWTTDLIRRGHVDVAPIADVHRRWGLQLAGWTEDINGVRVWTPPHHHQQEDDDMPNPEDLWGYELTNRDRHGKPQGQATAGSMLANIEWNLDAHHVDQMQLLRELRDALRELATAVKENHR